MGERANVYFVDDKKDDEEYKGVYLYTHWYGPVLPYTVQNALKRGEGRWDDPSYLCRIIFCEMTKDDVEGSTGFGISTYPVGPNYATIRVDPYRQRVDFVPESQPTKIPETDPPQSWSFSEYVKLSDDELHAAYMEAR